MQITLKLFSSLMEYLPAGTKGNSLVLDTSDTPTCHQLIDKYRIPRENVQVVMINGEFASVESRELPLSDGDTVSVWPAIQGG